MRMQLINKSQAGALLAENQRTFFTKDTGIQKMEPGDYTLLVEGAMPYPTTEGQLQIEALTDCESFELQEIQLCEPQEFSDSYQPSKYGIIFKEKIFVGEPTCVSLHLRLKMDGQEFASQQMQKLFKLEVFDNEELVHKVEGYD